MEEINNKSDDKIEELEIEIFENFVSRENIINDSTKRKTNITTNKDI